MAGMDDFIQTLAHYFEDALMDGGDGGFFCKYRDAALIASCDLAILFIDSRVEFVAFALEAVFVGALLLDVAVVAATGSLEGGC